MPIHSAGDSCSISSTNTLGECTAAYECPQAFLNNERPDLCSYSGRNAIICCPRDNNQNNRDPPGDNGDRDQREGSLRTSQMSKLFNKLINLKFHCAISFLNSFTECQEYSQLAVKKFSVSPLVLDPETFDFEVPNCDFSTPLIVDGEKTKAGEFPHMAALGWTKDRGDVGERIKLWKWGLPLPLLLTR